MTLAEVALVVRADTKRIRPDVEKSADGAGRAGGKKIGEGISTGIDKQLASDRGKFVTAGRNMGADLGKGFQGELGGGGTFAKTLAVMASRLAIMGAAAGAAAPGVAHLAAALAPAAGAAVALPAALLAIKAATATVKIAVLGVGDAISSGFGDDAKAAAKDLDNLSGSARAFAKEVIGLKPQVEGLQKTVSGRFFRPLIGEVQPLAQMYLPMLKARMGDLAGSLGGLGEQFLKSAKDAKVMSAVSTLFGSTTIASVRLRAAVDPVVKSFAALIKATAPELPGIATGFANMATNVAKFITKASESGQVVTVFNNAKDTLKSLGGILRNVGTIFAAVLGAASAGSGDLLSNLLRLTDQVAEFFQSAKGSGALTSVFQVLGDLGQALRTGLAAVLPAIAESIQVLAPAISGLAGPAATIVVALAPLLPFVAGFAAAVATALTPALTVLAKWLAENERILKIAVIGIVAFTAAAKLSAVAAGVQAAGGIAAWTKSMITGSTIGKAFTAVQYGIGAAMRFALGPIGLVIAAIALFVAAVVWAYKNNESFRVIVQKVWASVQKFIKSAMETIGQVIKTVWQNVIQPALRNLNTFVRTVVVPTVNYLWKTVVQPAFHAIGRIVQAAWAVIRLALAAMVAYYRNIVFPVIRYLWNNVVTPVFNGISRTIKAVWENGIRPVLKALGDFIKNNVAPGFKTGVDAITKAWKAVQEAARKPVAFVVNHVINPLIGGFNKMAGAFGTPKIDPIAGFAGGGRLPGSPGLRDNRDGMVGPGGKSGMLGAVRLMGREFVVNAKDTAKALPLLSWINRGMEGGPSAAARLIGRLPADRPGDGSEGWAFRKGGQVPGFAGGGLLGFFDDVWDVVSDPAKAITKPIGALLKQIPGSGTFVDILKGMGSRLSKGFLSWITGGSGGADGPGSLGKAASFLRAQAGKPYVWASAGPGGYDCSGIVSAAYNIIKGKSPYSHTFSTGSLPGGFFPKPGPGGPLTAGWAHPGQRGASANVGHMAGMLAGGLKFESTGSSGVRVGPAARSVFGFQHVGHFANGGLTPIAQTTAADFGSVTLKRGWNMVHNGLGRPEPLVDPSAAGGEVAELLRQLIAVTATNPAGFARAMGGSSTSLMREARRR
jgi:hypothetical protein